MNKSLELNFLAHPVS